jgi:hypothetical protein
MTMNIRRDNQKKAGGSRRGTAAVELAVALPFLFGLLFGVIEIGRGLEVAHLLTTAVREGGRFGATDKQGFVEEGESSHDKIVSDIRNFLVASGIPSGALTIECLTIPDGDPFDFDDPANHLKEFQVKVTVPFSAVTYCPPPLQKYFSPSSTISSASVFRNYHK